jgi:hypothetical protein
MGKLPDFLRSLADKRNAEGDSICELLIESAEYIEALESDKHKPPKTGCVTEIAAPTIPKGVRASKTSPARWRSATANAVRASTAACAAS